MTPCKHRSDAKGADEPNGFNAEIHGEPDRTIVGLFHFRPSCCQKCVVSEGVGTRLTLPDAGGGRTTEAQREFGPSGDDCSAATGGTFNALYA